MRPVGLFFLSCMLPLCVAASAQTVINSGTFGDRDSGRPATALPLRNLQIEVRQVEQDQASRERLEASISASVQPGQSSAAIGIQAQRRQSSRTGTAQQQVLVLNGRRAAIALGQAVPLRLLRTIRLNGIWRSVPGTVWLQAGTGFDALPRWDGSDMVELELSASRSRGAPTGSGADSSLASSTLILPLGEWMTIAQSDQDQDSQQSGLSGLGRSSSQNRLEVQVRVSVR
jgi:hypothetical protein